LILVDTSVWIEHLHARLLPAGFDMKKEIEAGNVVLGDLVMVEVLQGIRNERQRHDTLAAFRLLRPATLCGPDIAPLAAGNYRALRRRGVTVRSTIDVIMATWCIENGAALLHNDRDFDRIAENLPLRVLR
jgi:predicted nucleic acid-binding protein